MNPLAAIILIPLLFGVLFAPKRWALISLASGALYLTYGAGIQIAGFYVFPTRLLAYVCFLRVVLRREFRFDQLVKADKAIIVLYCFTSLMLIIRQDGTPQLAVAKALDGVLTYIVFRAFIQGFDDFTWFSRIFILLLVPFAAFLLVERLTQRNLFNLIGAAGEGWIRDGKIRCYGSFRHPSLLGSLGACFLPMFIGLMRDQDQRKRMLFGCILCVGIVLVSNSGGPVSVLALAIIGWFFWPLRRRMQTVRRALLGTILLLALVMKAPVWYLLARVSSITGGTGWHRSYLMDVAFKNISEWGLYGTTLESTADWFPYVLPATGSADITNQFIAFGIQAGIVSICLFVYFIVCAFSCLGKALAATREREESDYHEAILWGLGVSLAAHVSNWFGITYFDQFHLLWLLQMGALVSLSEFTLAAETDHEAVSESESEFEQFMEENPIFGQPMPSVLLR